MQSRDHFALQLLLIFFDGVLSMEHEKKNTPKFLDLWNQRCFSSATSQKRQFCKENWAEAVRYYFRETFLRLTNKYHLLSYCRGEFPATLSCKNSNWIVFASKTTHIHFVGKL